LTTTFRLINVAHPTRKALTQCLMKYRLTRPETPLLDQINSPADLRAMDPEVFPALARELRSFLLYSVGQTGGHFGAGLGVVELTIALHYVFNTPDDRLIWDVGHQTIRTNPDRSTRAYAEHASTQRAGRITDCP